MTLDFERKTENAGEDTHCSTIKKNKKDRNSIFFHAFAFVNQIKETSVNQSFNNFLSIGHITNCYLEHNCSLFSFIGMASFFSLIWCGIYCFIFAISHIHTFDTVHLQWFHLWSIQGICSIFVHGILIMMHHHTLHTDHHTALHCGLVLFRLYWAGWLTGVNHHLYLVLNKSIFCIVRTLLILVMCTCEGFCSLNRRCTTIVLFFLEAFCYVFVNVVILFLIYHIIVL